VLLHLASQSEIVLMPRDLDDEQPDGKNGVAGEEQRESDEDALSDDIAVLPIAQPRPFRARIPAVDLIHFRRLRACRPADPLRQP
jgi:hypothetical protein